MAASHREKQAIFLDFSPLPVKNSADAVFSAIFPSILTPPFGVFSAFGHTYPVTGHKLRPALAQAYRLQLASSINTRFRFLAIPLYTVFLKPHCTFKNRKGNSLPSTERLTTAALSLSPMPGHCWRTFCIFRVYGLYQAKTRPELTCSCRELLQ